ncbi:GYDIA family GHMP kinase [Ichthyenterobacterium sp. W332]|uniref:GYDIA family GHMP kinase n=1 Tax=Microcosmobacter mediterraneus TaxID=3075607 RepID=A0ABU2YMI6_9FLAO|nr:GYDIA family GHMP kinase [Ichthyenterobacterium sp. W332]MDT0558490.1 GYDIA family GHMP kinase [Ichthyenterobacterium sp. W332]
MIKNKTYYSNGKLLVTGEYVVLDGAKSLAVPTSFGQSLTVKYSDNDVLQWNSYDYTNSIWFEANFSVENNFDILDTNHRDIANKLKDILKYIQRIQPEFFKYSRGKLVETHLDFNREWGLGTSSTLINNLATWSNVDPYILLENTFGGSGYDIACAKYNKPITYQLSNDSRVVNTVTFNPEFKSHLYFVYLNQKKNSREAIAQYKGNQPISLATISEVSSLTEAIIDCSNLSEFQFLIRNHELIISKIINQETIQNRLFSDFKGQIKSLGAWGGDFILVASEINPKAYFKELRFSTVIPYSDMVL